MLRSTIASCNNCVYVLMHHFPHSQTSSADYMSGGFVITSSGLTQEEEEPTPILTTNEIIGIAVGGGVGVVLILVILFISCW